MKAEAGNILIIDDNEDVLLAARILLTQNSYKVRVISDPKQIPAILKSESFDVILQI